MTPQKNGFRPSAGIGRVLVAVPREEDVKFTRLCEGRGYPVLRIGVTLNFLGPRSRCLPTCRTFGPAHFPIDTPLLVAAKVS